MIRQRYSMIWLILFPLLAQAYVRFTNFKCTSFDESIATFEKCELKVIQRGVIALNIYAKLHKIPINDIWVNLGLYKRANGYKPFFYNITLDFCEYLRTRKRFPFFRMFFDSFRPYSNINHSCPFAHDIIVSNWTLKEDMFKLFPLPEGDYMFKLLIGINKVWKADTSGYVYKNDKAEK